MAMGSSTRASKRRRTSPATAPTAVSEEAALAALAGRRASVLEHAATVGTGTLLAWLQADLGLPDDAPLRPHRDALKRRALQMLEEQGQLAPAPAAATPGDLPEELLLAVLARLDHDTLFCALQACRAWRAAAAAPGSSELWAAQCARTGWGAPRPGQGQGQGQGLHLAAGQQQQRQQQQGAQPGQAAASQQAQQAAEEPDWRQRYREEYGRCCYDCFEPTQRRTLQAGTLRVRLCHACSEGYASARPHQRLVAATTAKRNYCLKAEELEALPRCVEPNPVNPAFTPMHLFRKLDVRRLAVAQWGSWEAVQAEHRRRITR